MSEYWYRISSWFYGTLHDGWNWLDSLNRQEWMVLLFVVMLLGFGCLRGFGSRQAY